MQFDQQHLSESGFTGFLRLRALSRGCAQIPARSGIYAVILESPASGFLARSVGGHFKGNDPTVAIDALDAKWLDDVATVYVGRANDLRRRLDLLARYGRGEPVAHQ